MACGGNFSQSEFDKLEEKKKELKRQSAEGRRLMVVFAKQLLAQEKRQLNLERKLEVLERRQDSMLEREARALGELTSLAEPGSEPLVSVEDNFFLQDDPESFWNFSSELAGVSDPSGFDPSLEDSVGDTG